MNNKWIKTLADHGFTAAIEPTGGNCTAITIVQPGGAFYIVESDCTPAHPTDDLDSASLHWCPDHDDSEHITTGGPVDMVHGILNRMYTHNMPN